MATKSKQIVTTEDELATALVKLFEPPYTHEIATKISEQFMEYCDDNGMDWDLIVDEFKVEDIKESMLTDAFVEIFDSLIEDGINIYPHTKDTAKLFPLLQQIKPVLSQSTAVINTNQQNDNFQKYKQKVRKLFEIKFIEEKAAKLIDTLDEFMDEEEFEFDGLVSDLVYGTESICVSTMINNLDWITATNLSQYLQDALRHDISTLFNPKSIILGVDEKEKENARAQFRQLCPSIFVSEHNKIGNLAIIKAIDIKNGNHGLLLMLWDTWTRYKIENNALTMDVSTFWDNKYSYNQWLKNKKYSMDSINHLKYGLQAFNTRILSSVSHNYVICDSFSQFVNYAMASSQFVEIVCDKSDINTLNMSNYKSQNTLPLLFDFWIIPKCTQKIQTVTDYDSDDSENEQKESTENCDDFCYLGYGGIDQNSAPIHSIGDIGTHLEANGYVKNTDFMCDEIAHNADMQVMKRRFLEIYKMMNKENETHKRFIFIVDRRHSEHYLHRSKCEKDVNIEMDCDKMSADMLYCIKDRSEIHKHYIQFPEVFFELSRNCILTKKDKIGIINGLNGYMFNLSYHLQSEDVAKCYWARNGEIRRFFKQDMCKCWPQHFSSEENGQLQTFDKSLIDNLYKDLKDDKFKLFYEETVFNLK